MTGTIFRRCFDMVAIGLLGACVAGVGAATLPEMFHRDAVQANPGSASGAVAGAPGGMLPALSVARFVKPRPEPKAVAAEDSATDVSDDKETLVAVDRLNVAQVKALYGRLGYDLGDDASAELTVPRLFLAAVPHGIRTVNDSDERKHLFLRILLPLVLKANEEVAADRARLLTLAAQKRDGLPLLAADRRWLEQKAEEYGAPGADPRKLLARVDTVPPSLALAQAAEESGWGTSRFARVGNALFGQWTSSTTLAMVPQGQGADGTVRIKAFPTLLDAVKGYVRNLNTHRAYAAFRGQREALRRAGRPLDGMALAGTLTAYSERGEAYVQTIRAIMRANDLTDYDSAVLSPEPLEVAMLVGGLDSLELAGER